MALRAHYPLAQDGKPGRDSHRLCLWGPYINGLRFLPASPKREIKPGAYWFFRSPLLIAVAWLCIGCVVIMVGGGSFSSESGATW